MLMATLGAFAGSCEPSDHVSVDGLMSVDEVFAEAP
jgi:hypothetical protein